MTPRERARRAMQAAGLAGPALEDALSSALAAATADAVHPAAVRANLDLHRRILAAVPGGVVVVDASGEILEANAEATRLLGLARGEMLQKVVADWGSTTIGEDGRPLAVEDYPVSRCLATGQPQPPMTIGVRRPGGDLMWAVFTAVPLCEADGDHETGRGPEPAERKAQAAIVTFLDVTARRRAEEALRRSEERFRSLVQGSPDHMCLVDERLTIVYINRVAGAYRLEEVVGRPAVEFMAPESRPVLERALRAAFDHGQASSIEVTVVSGGIYSERIVPLLDDAGGRVGRVLIIATEATERLRTEEERRRLDARLREAQHLEGMALLAAGIAHDFASLLVGIRGSVDLALGRVEGTAVEDAVGPLLLGARTATLRAADLTHQLLAYSGRGKLVVGPVHLNDLVVETLALMRATLSPRAAVALDLSPDLPPCQADATQVRQVIMNLLSNASEALVDGAGAVQVRSRLVPLEEASRRATFTVPEPRPGPWVELEVQDDGCGMSDETRVRVFDPFFTTKFTGRGLGLAAVMGIVRGHGGAIGVISAPGRGATFRVLLPASSAAPEAERPKAPAPAGGLVLVVDDERHVRAVARLALEGSGLRVLTADDGRQAVDLFRAHKDDVGCVVLDLLMPDMGGREAFDALREIRPDVRVILSSGYGEETDGLSGLSGVLKKPWAVEELILAVRRAMA